jgi:hypothetical protein
MPPYVLVLVKSDEYFNGCCFHDFASHSMNGHGPQYPIQFYRARLRAAPGGTGHKPSTVEFCPPGRTEFFVSKRVASGCVLFQLRNLTGPGPFHCQATATRASTSMQTSSLISNRRLVPAASAPQLESARLNSLQRVVDGKIERLTRCLRPEVRPCWQALRRLAVCSTCR